MKSPIRFSVVHHIAVAVFLLACVPTALAAPPASPAAWVTTWATSPFDGDPWHTVPTLVDSTLRQIVHTSIAGKQVRVRFTNEFGKEPLKIGAATIALSAGAGSVQPGSIHALAFGGSPSIEVPPGAIALSDPVDMATPALGDLAISIFLPLQQISDVSVHSGADQDNYIQVGNNVTAPTLATATVTPSWFFLKAVDVEPAANDAAAVVAFGDSITDGAFAGENKNERWPDVLAARLHNNPATANLSVLNEGIGGNCVLTHCVGQNALGRFDRDVLAHPGVKYLIILESINDIGALHNPNRPDYKLSAADLEQGLAQLVARAHEKGIKVFGATLTPYGGAFYYTEQGEQIREAVNDWIRHSGVFDGVIDFDKATGDPAQPLRFAATYDSHDHLHPNPAGYSAMANSIDLSLFR